jgi:predicted dehydrogenase
MVTVNLPLLERLALNSCTPNVQSSSCDRRETSLFLARDRSGIDGRPAGGGLTIATERKVHVGVVGAGRWAVRAHLPAYRRCEKAELVAICDASRSLATEAAARFKIPNVCNDYHDLIDREDIDVVDVCASAVSHYPIALAAIEKGKAVLCEKPLAMSYEQALTLSERASAARVKTMMGFTFRYSPVLLRVRELLEEGFVGEPYLFNGYEQNSQFVNPATPFRWNPGRDPSRLMPGSLEEYAPHLIDISLWLLGEIKQVAGSLKNFIPVRKIRDLGKTLPINIEDTAIWLAEFRSGTQATFQSSMIAIGGYPGIEIRIFGSKGAIIARLVEERGVTETLRVATPENTAFRQVRIPARLYYPGYEKRDDWIQLYFGNLVRSFITEVAENGRPGATFEAGVNAQEVEDAVYLSHLDHAWVSLPLDEDARKRLEGNP